MKKSILKSIISVLLLSVVMTNAQVLAPESAQAAGAVYYISPGGSDSNSGLSSSAPLKTFAKAFSVLPAGGELILLDGTYGVAQGTGIISYSGANSAQIPSGLSRDQMTYVHAQHPGNVRVLGVLSIGRSTRKDSFIKIDGITFDVDSTGNGGADIYNSNYIYIKNSGFHSETQSANSAVFGIGTNDGEWGNTNILLEDSWVWGKERIALLVYRSNNIVIRRVVFRQDGCFTAGTCGSNSGNYMVGSSIYNSHHVSFQNVISVDGLIGPNGFGGAGDFYTAWHDNYVYPWYANEWLGSIALNSQLGEGFAFDLDPLNPSGQPMATYRDDVAWNVPEGFNAQHCCTTFDMNVSNITIKANGSGDGFRIDPNWVGTNTVKNLVVNGVGRYAVNSRTQPSYVDVSGAWSAQYNQANCVIGCKTSNPFSDGSIKYITRIENGSPLKGTGAGGADYGANVMYAYGSDGTFFGEVGYNTLTAKRLWPWPNDSLIRSQMCAGVTRGMCSTTSLTRYVWEAAGNAMPSDFYNGSSTPSPTPTPIATPTPTATPPPSVTPTPTPTPTSTPTPSVTPSSTPAPTASPSIVALRPVADAYVTGARPRTNYGRSATLYSDGSPAKISYLKFDLSALAGKTAKSAVLRIRTTANTDATTDKIQQVAEVPSSAWGEYSVTYNNRPAVSRKIGLLSGAAINTSYDIPLDTAVLNEYLGSKFSLAVFSEGDNGMYFYSREGKIRPELIVTTNEMVSTALSLNRYLTYGLWGDDVAALQDFLVARNLLPANSVTGFYGKMTQSAVRELQRIHKLASTGTVGSYTRALISGLTR